MSNELLIFGAGGQVGRALTRLATDHGFLAIGFSSSDASITDARRLTDLARAHPDAAVVNAAAYTAVDHAEDHHDTAFAVNAVGPAFLAALFGNDRPLLHFSTDYVFPGTASEPYTEDLATHPLGIYGMSKRAGELPVLQAQHGTVMRTAWVYDGAGQNFLRTMIRVGRDRGSLKVVNDQFGTPTHADDIANAALRLLRLQVDGESAGASGLYHFTAKGQTSWHGFAAEIFAHLAEQTGERVGLDAIPSSAYPTKAARPAFSVLDCAKIDRVPGIVRPEWQDRVGPTVKVALATGFA